MKSLWICKAPYQLIHKIEKTVQIQFCSDFEPFSLFSPSISCSCETEHLCHCDRLTVNLLIAIASDLHFTPANACALYAAAPTWTKTVPVLSYAHTVCVPGPTVLLCTWTSCKYLIILHWTNHCLFFVKRHNNNKQELSGSRNHDLRTEIWSRDLRLGKFKSSFSFNLLIDKQKNTHTHPDITTDRWSRLNVVHDLHRHAATVTASRYFTLHPLAWPP